MAKADDALLQAAQAVDLAALIKALEDGANVDRDKKTALMWAVDTQFHRGEDVQSPQGC